MSILRLAFPPELKRKISALPVFANLFIYREKIRKLYGISGLVNGVRNLTGACPVKYIEDVDRREFNRVANFI